MRARLPVMSVRLLVLASVWLLASATFTLAKDDSTPVEPAETTTGTNAEELDDTPVTTVLVVPDVRDLPYVFAKGVLEDAGLAWRVEGDVEGYAVNLVNKQSVEPGTKVIDTGAPTLVLRLERNPDYDELGLPDDSSPYPGTKMQLASEADPGVAETDEQAADPAESEGPVDESDATAAAGSADDEPVPSTDVEAVAETVTEPSDESADARETDEAAAGDSEADTRPPAFSEPGAPPEPLDEMPLPDRAKRLGAWLAEQSSMGPAAWDHYTYQHAWVVTGAGFGWWRGAEALRILIDVDEQLQKRFDVGGRLEQEARRVLAEVLHRAAGP